MAAYYYPGFHADPARDILRKGGHVGERSLLDDPAHTAAYPDVRRPRQPLVEPTAQSLADDAALALSFGVDAFLWCWYWDRGRLHFNKPLELWKHSPLPMRFRYALMWTNKRPHFELPMGRTHNPAEHRQRLVTTDVTDFGRMAEHLVAEHFSSPHYLKINGKPLVSIFLVRELMRQHGTAGMRQLLDTARDVAKVHGLPGICFVAVVHQLRRRRRWASWLGLDRWTGTMNLREAGFDAASTYVYLPHWQGPALQSYGELVRERPAEWPKLEASLGVPLWPSVSPGWDARVRGEPIVPAPEAHPWAPLIRDETPAEFGELLRTWKRYAEPREVPLLTVASWNEWTEGHAVAPCDRHGDGMMRQLREIMGPADPADGDTR